MFRRIFWTRWRNSTGYQHGTIVFTISGWGMRLALALATILRLSNANQNLQRGALSFLGGEHSAPDGCMLVRSRASR